MLRAVLFCCLVAVAVATPLVARSKADVEEYRNYLLRSQSYQDEMFIGPVLSPKHPEMYSGKFQGDIILDDEAIEDMVAQYAAGRNAVIFPGLAGPWPNNTVIWKFADEHFEDQAEREMVFEAIKDIEAHTCVRFREALETDRIYVNVTNYFWGCWAHVGYRSLRGVHNLNLGNHPSVQCFRHATIVHEWMHILGFFHMHATHDRDDYIRVNYENIVPGAERDFDNYNEFQSGNLGVEYDYVSCLHYPELAWSFNGLPTIEALREHEGEMGQRDYVSDSDWLRINRYYNCPGAWEQNTTV